MGTLYITSGKVNWAAAVEESLAVLKTLNVELPWTQHFMRRIRNRWGSGQVALTLPENAPPPVPGTQEIEHRNSNIYPYTRAHSKSIHNSQKAEIPPDVH